MLHPAERLVEPVDAELLTWLTFKVGGLALKGAKATAKGVARGAQTIGRGAKAAGRGVARVVRRGAQYVIKQGKVLLKGIAGTGIGRAAKRLDDLARRLLGRTRFKGFRVRLRSRWFILEGKVNPWVKIAEGRLVEVDGPQRGALEVDDVAKAQRDFDHLTQLRRQGGESIDDWTSRVRQIQEDAYRRAVGGDESAEALFGMADDFLDPSNGKIARQSSIEKGDALGNRAWSERQEVWAGLKLKGGMKADADFWRQIDNAYSADELARASQKLDDLEDAVSGWKSGERDELLKDIAERRAKLDHKQRRLTAQERGMVTDDELIDQIVNGGKGTDVYAGSREQAERIKSFLEAVERNASRSSVEYTPKNFHGPETHKGTRVDPHTGQSRRGLNPNTAPDEPHVNVKGGAGGDHYEVHIYYPE